MYLNKKEHHAYTAQIQLCMVPLTESGHPSATYWPQQSSHS